ncbi:MAG: OmpA family protein [Bacteroidetes bacterium]|nr:OmpA family protein [Bacteroidota bacterium]
MLSIFLFGCIGFAANGQKLFLESSFFNGEEITDMVEWQGTVWASTNTGLFELSPGKSERIAVPPVEHDLITTLNNSTPFALVCGTYMGNLLFIQRDANNFCNVSWELHDPRSTGTFYITSVAQTSDGIWAGTLERGVYRIDPKSKDLKNFPLDYNYDTIGINVYDIAVGKYGEVWASSQDGLYFINKFFNEDTFSYIKSSRIKKPINLFKATDQGVYVLHKNAFGKKKIKLLTYSSQALDIKVQQRYSLPKSFESEKVRAFTNDANGRIWVLGNDLWCKEVEDWKSYKVPLNVPVREVNKLVVIGNKVWMSTKRNGVYLLSTQNLAPIKPVKALTPLAIGVYTDLENVFFNPGDTALESSSFEALDMVVDVLNGNSNLNITINGHTASDGDSTFLYALSLGRARSVSAYLLNNGIEPTRIKVAGFGDAQLKNPRQPKSGINRRVEVIVKE